MKRLAASTVATIIVCGVVLAHDAEHTAVSVTFARDGSFAIEVANDPNWLLLRLESFVALEAGATARGRAQESSRSALERDARLRALAPLFIDRIVFFVDGHEVRPISAEYLAPPAQGSGGLAPLAAYRLRGRLSAEARMLRWYYGMVVDPYPLVINRADGTTLNEWIVAGEAWSTAIDLTGQFVTRSRREIARHYLRLGYSHVLPRGVPHVLFIVGLFLLATGVRSLALQIGAFTIASALALWLVAYQVLSVSATIAAGLVALSVVYIVIENLLTTGLKPWRVPLVFAFGLAHGAAFGLVVKELALTAAEMPMALLWFTVGVEGGQLTVLALISILMVAVPTVRSA